MRIWLAIVLLLAGASARAQSGPTTSEEPVRVDPPAPGSGYRLEVIAADAISFGAFLIPGFALEGNPEFNPRISEALSTVGVGGYFFGGPAIHLAHRRWGRAAISLAARVGIPVLGAAIGAQTASCTPNEWFCGLDEAAAGAAIGAFVAAVVDSALIVPSADSSTPEPAHAAVATRPSARMLLSPRLVAAPNVAMLGIGGRF